MRRIALLALLATPMIAADWIEYRSGPFRIFSNAGDREARDRMAQLEQLRHSLGQILGKTELSSVWPVTMVLFPNQREYAPRALQRPLMDGGSSMLAAWTADTPLPLDLLRALTQMFLDDNAGKMPQAMETAVTDLFSTIEVSATRVKLGAPASGLPADRMRLWAKLQMLATQPEYSGKLRTYINNLQNAGEEDAAARNAFDLTLSKLEERVDAYLKAGKFEAAPVSGRPLNPNKDFIEKNVTKPQVDALMQELAGAGKTFAPDTPRGLAAKNTRAALELAVRANPKWAEPHVKLAELDSSPAIQLAQLKIATSLAPRSSSYWQMLAKLQESVNQFADAEKSWLNAEHTAPDDLERDRIHQAKLAEQARRSEFELAEKKRLADEAAADLQRVKDSANAEVKAAEDAANARLAKNGSTAGPVVRFSDLDGGHIAGQLTKVECKGADRILTIKPRTGSPLTLLLREAAKISFGVACGDLDPVRNIDVFHDAKPDRAVGTAGRITALTLP